MRTVWTAFSDSAEEICSVHTLSEAVRETALHLVTADATCAVNQGAAHAA